MKPARRRHDLDTLTGNRVWVVTAGGTKLIQKLFSERRPPLQMLAKRALNALRGTKSSPAAHERCRVEHEMLAHWTACGFAVPRDRTDDFPRLAGPPTALLEFVEGKPLGALVGADKLAGTVRAGLLARFAADWGMRHARALADDDPMLVHEHGSVEHVLVRGEVPHESFVTIDLERRYTPGTDVLAVLAREIVGTLRSLAKRSGPARLEADFDAVLAGYPDHDLLRATVRHYLEPRGWLGRQVTRLDRRREQRGRSKCGKYAAVEALEASLRRAGSARVQAPTAPRPNRRAGPVETGG